MNIACPACGGMNNYMNLPWPPEEIHRTGPPHGHNSEYVCLQPVDGNLRCGAVFRVDVPATLVGRPLRSYEIEQTRKQGIHFAHRDHQEHP